MRLRVDGNKIQGVYDFAGGSALIFGKKTNSRFDFRYKEDKIEGEGWFELSEYGAEIQGKWRADGREAWQDWVGKRSSPQPERVWLVILEANWETNISEPGYAFGEMLTQYFSMATTRHIQVRHRFFHDETDLGRFWREIQFFAEPVVLLISPQGIIVNGTTIQAEFVVQSLADAPNLQLLHLSGCAMMSGDFPKQIHTALGDHATFPISGYQTNVAWDASAIGDFTYLFDAVDSKNVPREGCETSHRRIAVSGNRKNPGNLVQTTRTDRVARSIVKRVSLWQT